MNIVRNILAVILGAIIGGLINGATIAIGTMLIPPPAGFDQSTTENFAKTVHLLQPINYLVVFLAHALGAFVGSLVAMFIAVSHRLVIAMIIGALFLLGGTMVAFMAPIPVWYTIVDLLLAYVPMAFIGYKLSRKQ